MPTKTLNELYFDESIKRQLFFLDFTEQQVREVSKENDRLEEALIIALIKAYTLDGATRSNIIKLRQRLDRFELIYNDHYKKILDLVSKDYSGVARSEFEFNRDFFNENFGVRLDIKPVSKKDLNTITTIKNMVGRPLIGKKSNWFKDLSQKEYLRFKTRIQQGFADGLSVGEIIKNVKGTKALNYRDGIFKGSKRNLETLVRTGYNFVQQESNRAIFNYLGATHIRYSAILDARTTFICGQRDGNIYTIIEAPIIPAHFNCRSTYISVFDLDLIAQASGVRNPQDRRKTIFHFKTEARKKYGLSAFDKLSKSQQARIIQAERTEWARVNIGSPVTKIKYRDWFEQRTDAWKVARLGKKRFDLYQTGGLKYLDLINRQGKLFTIQELNNKYNITKGL